MQTIQIEEIQKSEVPAVPGTAFAGGFYYGQINIDGDIHALIVSPKVAGEFAGSWGQYGDTLMADSVFDGMKNTHAMAAAGSYIAKRALSLTINGKLDWYIPSRDEMEVLYRNQKPTSRKNGCWWRDGENLNAVPPTAAYTEGHPAQTAATAFQIGGEQALDDTWYWTSTQVSAYNAAFQRFSDGAQHSDGKICELRVRVVRRLKIV